MNLKRRTAIVTGAGRGIGRAIALAFGRAGATVICCSRNEAEIEQTASLVESAGGTVRALVADITDEDAVGRLVRSATAATGRLDVVFNNAGTNRSLGNLWEIPVESWWGDISTNLLGTYLVCRAAIPIMINAGEGIIVNMVGGGFNKPFPGAAAYACSKAAVNRLTDTLAAELADARTGLLVFGFAPGLVKTELSQAHANATRPDGSRWAPGIQTMFDDGRDCAPEDVADAAVHLISIASPEHNGRLYRAGNRAFAE